MTVYTGELKDLSLLAADPAEKTHLIGIAETSITSLCLSKIASTKCSTLTSGNCIK